MLDRTRLSRRGFVGGVATAVGYLTLKSPMELMAHERAALGLTPLAGSEDYDHLAHLANNENPYGPPESVMKAMTQALQVREPVRRTRRRYVESIAEAPWREAGERPARRRLRRDSRRRGLGVRGQRQEGRRRRAIVQPSCTRTSTA